MKNKDLKKVCCIFLLFVIILPLFSNFVNTREGNKNKKKDKKKETKSYCVSDKTTKLESSDYSNYSGGETSCHKLKSTDTCSDYYMLHKHKKTATAYPCKTRETSS
tara:strand:+ start:78 stop:395 length:318 start_codon:yes stop_codon:yes gene_type:complete